MENQEAKYIVTDFVATNMIRVAFSSIEPTDNEMLDFVYKTDKPIKNKAQFQRILDYLVKATDCETSTLLYIFPLIDKFLIDSGIVLTKYNMILITITAFSLSLKFNEDFIIDDKAFALELCKLKRNQLYLMELNFLETIDYRLNFNIDDINQFSSLMEMDLN